METARCGHLIFRVVKAFSSLRFFVAKDQEMTRRHAQWLIVIKRKSDTGRPLTPKASTRHRPKTTTARTWQPITTNAPLPHKPKNPPRVRTKTPCSGLQTWHNRLTPRTPRRSHEHRQDR